nr:hypothetical protein [Wohlfahrtiimonas chitiniclastica]
MKKVIYVLLLSIFLQPSFARDSEPKIIGEFFYIAGGTGVSEYMVPVSIELMTYQKVRFGYTLVAEGVFQIILAFHWQMIKMKIKYRFITLC